MQQTARVLATPSRTLVPAQHWPQEEQHWTLMLAVHQMPSL
jgi:hypothetical protein